MKQPIVYALDFDGVICDSAIETGIAGWKSAIQVWDGFSSPLPSKKVLDQFREVRPVMETGYEAILVIKMLNDGDSVESILMGFSSKKEQLIKDSSLDVDFLKNLFGEIRDQWIKNDIDDWVKMNPLFTGVIEKLKYLTSQDVWYIITTKQERFVKLILTANQIQISDDRVFGLDKKISKEAVLVDLVKKHPNQAIYFVEDRLAALLNVINNRRLKSVQLYLATWGYNNEKDKIDAKKKKIELIGLDEFLV
ncbi:MAG: HAD family hydrolase [Methylococcaceae bacterium]|nr:HAD family hydrolase [Methylococcaceae bacterium]